MMPGKTKLVYTLVYIIIVRLRQFLQKGVMFNITKTNI